MSTLTTYRDGSLGSGPNMSAMSDGSLGSLNMQAYQNGTLGNLNMRSFRDGTLGGCGCRGVGEDKGPPSPLNVIGAGVGIMAILFFIIAESGKKA